MNATKTQEPASLPAPKHPPAKGGFLLCLVCLLAVIAILFSQSLEPGKTLFANDTPLGGIAAQADHSLSLFKGYWQDLNWLGNQQPGAVPNITQTLFLLLGSVVWGKAGPVIFTKLYAPVALLILGLSAWFLFRQLRFSPLVSLLGGLAAMLNMSAFSNACWGLPTWALARAMVFVALGMLVSRRISQTWIKLALAGLAVGVNVMEGFDSGAIYSLYVAAFVFFLALIADGQSAARRVMQGAGKVGLMAALAVLIAAPTLTTLIGTQIKGIAGTQQDERTKEERWDFATQWSLPKIETLRLIIPGLFGYRMDTPQGGEYWGAVGRQPGWEKHHQGYLRHTGSGEYAGVLVVLLAFWAVLQSLRGKQSPYAADSRKMIWFWALAAVVSLLLAYGRHAPFYRILYALPYFSTIRNPIKFLQPFHVATLILFAYGLQDLWRRYLESGSPASHSIGEQLKRWWNTANPFDKLWTKGSMIALAAALLGWLVYAAERNDLVKYLQRVAFNAEQSAAIAGFSLGEVGIFVLFFGLSALFLAVILSGAFAGQRAKWAMVMLGLLLAVDLSRANQPWIRYYNYKEKYASNPIIDILHEKPYERRVAIMPFGIPQLQAFHAEVYHKLWLQHHFPYYHIQSLNDAQDPRPAQEKTNYVTQVSRNITRYWQLTNTRLLFGMNTVQTPKGPANFVDFLNEQMDPVQHRFRLHTAFDLMQPGPDRTITAQTNAAGQFALIEFTGALPRAKLYSRWEVSLDEKATLKRLADPQFDPEQTVLIGSQVPPPAQGNATNQNPGTVEFARYLPMHIKLNVDAKVPSVLLLNDRYQPDWKVWVNGQPAPLLRCNFIVRGVQMPAGTSVVEFRFQPPITALYVSLAAVAFGLGLVGFAALARKPEEPSAPTPKEQPAPAGKDKRKSK